jgi:sigma-B regulation protein RsbU (phosphoserine phosphatase)
MSDGSSPTIELTDILGRSRLQELQDAFSRVTGLMISIRDVSGETLTDPSDSKDPRSFMLLCESGRDAAKKAAASACAQKTTISSALPHAEWTGMQIHAVAVVVEKRCAGVLLAVDRPKAELDRKSADRLVDAYGIASDVNVESSKSLAPWTRDQHKSALWILNQLGDLVSLSASQGLQLRQRIDELTAIHDLTSMIVGRRELQTILDNIAKKTAEAMNVKACSIRLLDDETGDLLIQAVCNLSQTYIQKGPISREKSRIDQAALAGEIVFIEDFPNDPRTLYPEEARREGLASCLVSGLVYHGTSIGVMRVYSGWKRRFTPLDGDLLRTIAVQAAAAITNARLLQTALEKADLDQQIRMAGEVQRRMLPRALPRHKGLEFSCFYEPCIAVGGDYYDFINLSGGRLGAVIADVVGHGIPASLLMASMRSVIRLHSQEDGPLTEMMAKVNDLMTEETQPNEFASIFIGAFDADARIMEFVCAGHEPSLLLRQEEISELGAGGLVAGIQRGERYVSRSIQLEGGDRIVLLTDGIVEALNYDDELYGRGRFRESLMRHQRLPLQEWVSQLAWDVRRFAGLNEQIDDLTIIGIEIA